MRIVHVSDCYAPRTGGIETHLRELTRVQASHGHDVHVFTSELGSDGERNGTLETHDGVTVHRLGTLMPLHAPWNPVAGITAARLLDELAPDVVHAHAGIMCPLALSTAKSSLARGIPVAITWHSMLDHSRYVLTPWVRLTGWKGAPAAMSAVGRTAADQVERVFGGEVRVLHDGIDQTRWLPAPEPPDAPPPLRCVATSRLVPKKGLGALIDMVGEAADDLPQGGITLDIFGSGPDRRRLENRIAKRRLEGVVRLRGRKTSTELAEEYRRAHVFCAPSRREAFGIAGLEARTAGLILVARRGTGLEEYARDRVDSLLVADSRQMHRSLTRLATDRELFERLRDEARGTAPDFSYERIVSDNYDEYERAAELAGTGVHR
jgi:glycosyltransferase involved in cell wall biosynthesis